MFILLLQVLQWTQSFFWKALIIGHSGLKTVTVTKISHKTKVSRHKQNVMDTSVILYYLKYEGRKVTNLVSMYDQKIVPVS